MAVGLRADAMSTSAAVKKSGGDIRSLTNEPVMRYAAMMAKANSTAVAVEGQPIIATRKTPGEGGVGWYVTDEGRSTGPDGAR